MSDYLVDLADAILEWSDNDSYHAMRDSYGAESFRQVAIESGCDLSYYYGDSYTWAYWYYPRTSPHDLLRLWQHFSPYILDTKDDGANTLREMMLQREVAPITDGLLPSATIYGKAGWMPEYGDCDATPAAVDAGIVLWPDGRSYLVSIMTDTEEDLESVSRLASCIDRLHHTIVASED